MEDLARELPLVSNTLVRLNDLIVMAGLYYLIIDSSGTSIYGTFSMSYAKEAGTGN